MPAHAEAVGVSLQPFPYTASTRRILAFASILGALDQLHDDADNFAALPQLCVIPEWQLTIASRSDNLGLSATEIRMAVHAGQDTQFHRLIAPEESLQVCGEVLTVKPSRAGALVVTKFETRSVTTDDRVATTLSTAIYRGVAVSGQAVETGSAEPAERTGKCDITVSVPLDRGFAHRYSECADIWNPIHTERSVALAAGLPDIIVHGTAIWALAGQEIIKRYCDGDPSRLQRLAGRFTAMVIAGDAIEIESGVQGHKVSFVVKNAQGEQAISAGSAQISG